MSEELTPQIVNPEAANIVLPPIDNVLSDRLALDTAVFAPQSVFEEATHAAPDADKAELEGRVLSYHNQVLRDVIAPESLVHVGKKIVGELAEEATHVLSIAGSRLGEANDKLKGRAGIEGHLSEIDESITYARRAFYEIEDLLSRPRYEYDDIQYATAGLRTFDEIYEKSRRDIANKSELVSEDVGISGRFTDQGAEVAHDSFRKLVNAENAVDQDPMALADEMTADKVVERGSATVEEHKNACSSTVTEQDSFIGDTANKLKSLTEDLRGFSGELRNSDATNTLARSQQVTEVIENLKRALYSKMEYGNEMQRMVQNAMDEAQGVIENIARSLSPINDKNNANSQKIAEFQSRTQRVKSSIQEVL
jgi:hypothetical protein